MSKASVFAVCSYCQSSLVKQGLDLEAIGKISELHDDLTPIQIGTTGVLSGDTFEVIGRLKVAYEDGFWNEWFTIGHQGLVGWLAEAQGFYALCFPVTDVAMPDKSAIQPGRKVSFGPFGYYEIEDIHEVTCMYSEGELPINAVQGRKSLSVDLTSDEGGMATIEYANQETRAYRGAYQDFDAFQFKNLRPIDGW